MRLSAATLTLTLLLAVGGPLRAEEPPHLDFVRGLREKGMPDLALEYLQGLKSRKDLPADVARQLPLEIAKTGLDLAQQEADPARKEALYAEARDAFAAFLKNNPKSPVAAAATLELARANSLQGKSHLAHAQRAETAAARKGDQAKARSLFEQAGQRLAEAATLIDGQLARTDLAAGDKRALTRAKYQAELDRGLNLLDQALAYGDEELLKRGETIKKAMDALRKVADGDENNPAYWEAQAWLGRCEVENDSPKDAEKQLAGVARTTGSAAAAGRRLARYFQLLAIDRDSSVKDPDTRKRTLAEDWLRDYPEFARTPEGQGVRFQLAGAYLGQALKRPKSQFGMPDVQQLFRRARELYEGLEQPENEFSQQARDQKLRIIITASNIDTKGDIARLRDFQECYLRAQVEIYTMTQEEKSPPKGVKPEDARKEHFQNIVAALNRALSLADAKTPPADLTDARYILAYAYLETGEPYRAAVLGESLARAEPRSPRAATAAAYALDAYAQVIGEDQRNDAARADLEADQGRLRSLALYMEKTWPADPATDLARQQLATLAVQAKKYREAIDILSRIAPSYYDYTQTQYQLANAALDADKEGLKPAPGQPSYPDQAAAALQRIPDLASGASPATAQVYFYAKAQLATLLLKAKQYKQLDGLSGRLVKQWAESGKALPESARNSLEPFIQLALPLYVKYGEAEAEARAGHYENVLKLLDPVVAQVKQGQLAAVKEPALVQYLLGLALRANVREGKTKAAQEILDLLLQQSAAGLQGTSVILQALIQQMREQIEELRKRGPPAQAELDKTVASFSAFLDELGKQPPAKLTPDLVRFIAFGYASLEQHEKAANLLKPLVDACPEAGKDPEKDAFCRALWLLYIQELRRSKQFDKAREALRTVLKTPWGGKSVDVKKEACQILEDEEKFLPAAHAWNDLMGNLRPQLERNAKLKDLYFECYYHLVVCVYRNAAKMPDEARKKDGIRRAATWIIKLKRGKPDMGGELLKKKYDELLEKEEALKQACEALEKESS